MGLPRFYLPPEELKGSTITFKQEALEHLRARRVRAGQRISLFDAQGGEAVALVSRLDRKDAQAEIVERPQTSPSPALKISLGLGLCRWERLRMAVEKATELGAFRIRPILAQRSRPLGRGLKDKLERVVIESLKQCYRSRGPEICEPAGLGQVMDQERDFDLKLILDREGPRLTSMKTHPPQSVFLLVGPEGGFDQAEKEAALNSGFRPACLSPAVLRAETAALAGLALVTALWEQTCRVGLDSSRKD